MRSRLTYLLTSIFILVTLVQCEDTVQISEPESELTEPTLLAPEENTEQSTSLTFDWNNVEGAESYQIKIATNEDFTSTIVDSVIKVTNFDISSLPSDTTIHWQVAAQGENPTNLWSEKWQFSTESAPENAEPVYTELQDPKDGSSDQATDVNLRWTTIASASAYNIEIATDENFNSIVAEKEVTNSSYSSSSLDNQQTYYWRVQPVVSGQETQWSSTFSFTTVEEGENVAAVNLVAPSDGATSQSTTLTLEWDEISDVSDYQIQLATDNSFSSPVVDETVSEVNYESSDLENGQTYYWRVQASGDNNDENWSSVREFQTEQETNTEPPVSNSGFVSAENSDFVLDGETFRFAGTNAYYLPAYEQINSSEVDQAFDAFEEAGITVIRMWGFYDGPAAYDNDISLQPEAGVYNEEDLQHLDNVVAKAKEHNIRIVFTFLNYWSQLGGVPQYNEWAGNSGGGMSSFINDADAQQWFKDYISMIINRENTVTGKKYKNESAIFSWEIINEARLPGGDPEELRDWYQDIAQHIKSEDPNHMVSTGEEGFEENTPSEYSSDQYSNNYVLRANKGTSYKLNTAIPEIDYGTAHWYPENWGLSATEFSAQRAWLSDHAEIAEQYDKPFVIGEWGDDNGYANSDHLAMYENYWSHAEDIQLDGSLLWQFTATGTKCYEFGGNICWPGGRQDEDLYNSFRDYIQAMNNSN